MQLLIDPQDKRAVDDLFTDRMARIPDFSAGEAVTIDCCPVKRIRMPYDSRVFNPIDPNDWVIQASIRGLEVVPITGTWTITFTALDTSTETTAAISADPNQAEISAALNALVKVTAIGGIAVTGGNGFFVFTFNEVGARNLLAGDPSALVPPSLLTFERIVTGNLTTKEVQILRIAPNAGACTTLDIDTETPEIVLETVVQGDATHNHKVRVTLPENRYGGSWTLTVTAVESTLIGYDDNDAQIQAIVEAISSVGTGNVEVERESDDSFLIAFKGDLALEAVTVAADGSALQVILFKNGVLDLNCPGVQMLLNGDSEAVVRFEVDAADDTGYTAKILQRDVILWRG